MKKIFGFGWTVVKQWRLVLVLAFVFVAIISVSTCTSTRSRAVDNQVRGSPDNENVCLYAPDSGLDKLHSRLQCEPCMTKCGIRMFGSNDCDGLQAAENKAVAIYRRHVPDPCAKFDNWNIYVQPLKNPREGWARPDQDGGMVVGLAWCQRQVIQTETDDWPHSSVFHEFVHVVECDDYWDGGDAHFGWDTGWQYRAIEEACKP